MPVWSDKAMDYSAGHDIVDAETGKVYSETEAKAADKKTKAKLLLRARRFGAFVMSLDECEAIMHKKRVNSEVKNNV